MPGIFGIATPNKREVVSNRIKKIRHRGCQRLEIVECSYSTLGEARGAPMGMWIERKPKCKAVFDGVICNWHSLSKDTSDVDQAIQNAFEEFGPSFLTKLDGYFALAIGCREGVLIARDKLGIAPLYYGYKDGTICFASEAKALLGWASDIKEFPPGCYYNTMAGFVSFTKPEKDGNAYIYDDDPSQILISTLTKSIAKYASVTENIGCWLSGGIDSSTIAAIASNYVPKLKTFSIGLEGAPDLLFARQAAASIGSTHFEICLKPEELIKILPQVIYTLESFDALLVRSSLTNYLVGKLSSEYVEAVFSGEGADELFAGYDYLKNIPEDDLNNELLDITNRLHNTALQRVDRCSNAHGLKVFLPFLDEKMVSLAFSMDPSIKIRREQDLVIEKWVLRKAAEPLLPDDITKRQKAKFWQGTGVEELLQNFANSAIRDKEFDDNKILSDGTLLNSKEEYLYYSIFTEFFGKLDDYSFIGRTKIVQ